MKRRTLTAGVLVLAFLLYQAPNIALLAYGAGFALVEPRALGLEVKVKNGWYPLATNDSLIGQISIPKNAPQMITFHRPSILWPWKADIFAVMSMTGGVDPKRIESTQTLSWGTASLLKPVSNDPIRLYAVVEVKAGVLAMRVETLQDIEVLAAAK